jgi:hypothetical protein
MAECAERARLNQVFFEKLDQDMGGRLLLPGKHGSLIVARNESERQDMRDLETALQREGRVLHTLTAEAVRERYGFVPPNGVAFAEKPHDRLLTPNFMRLLADRVSNQLGGRAISGTVTTIYTDRPEDGGFVEYQTNNDAGQTPTTAHVPFSKLVLSLGNQRVLAKNDTPLLDIVAARG